MKQLIPGALILMGIGASQMVTAALPKTRTDMLLPREELGPEALVEVVTWARGVVAAGKRGDATAARALVAALPEVLAPLPVEDEPVEPLPVVIIPPVGEEQEPLPTTLPVDDEVPEGALVAVMSWCNEMLAAARAGDRVACEEVLSRSPVALPVVTGDKDKGVSRMAAAIIGGSAVIAGIIIGVVIMGIRR